MRTILAGLTAATALVAVAGLTPAAAMPAANLGASQAKAAANNVVDVRWRRHYVRRHWVGPRYRYWGAPYPYPYYAYSYPYRYRYYAPGPWVRIGPFGFGFW